jgi:hypothetical protein
MVRLVLLPGGKRIKESLGTADKRQAQELHDKRKAELWRVDRLGDFPDVTLKKHASAGWRRKQTRNRSIPIKAGWDSGLSISKG